MYDAPAWSDSLTRQLRLVRKELTEILRDRRTIVTLAIMPLLIYPLLRVGFVQFFRAMAPMRDLKFIVGADDLAALDAFARIEQRYGPLLKVNDDDRRPTWLIAPLLDSADTALRAGDIDIALSLESKGRTTTLQATYLKKSTAGSLAARWAEKLLNLANAETLDSLLSRRGAPPGERIELVRHVIATDEGDGMISLASIIPFILILMTITGAVYPAIDLTAGERERGTLEILVAAPVPRLNLLIAKYAAVVFVALLTAVINLVAMTATMLLNPFGQALLGEGAGITALMIVELLGLLVLFALFFSAVLLTITSFARSFKEAQAYLIPVMLVAMTPGIVGLIPDLRLSPILAAVPLVNIVLLGRDLLEAKASAAMASIVVVSTLLYAAAALSLAARVFGAEAVLYNERNSWSDLFRRPRTPQPEATPSTALWSLALMVPLFFTLEAAIRFMLPRCADALGTSSIPYLMVAGMTALSLILFVGVPALFASRERLDWRSGFGLIGASWRGWLAALLLAVSVWALALPLLQWLRPAPPEWLREAAEQMMTQLQQQTPLLRGLFVASLMFQAVVEELYFRGYLWNALERRTGIFWTLIITSALFGLGHVVTGGLLGLEKLAPTTLLGLLLGIVRWRTGSVGPGMLQHAVHNALLAAVAPVLTQTPWPMYAGAGLLTAIAIALLISGACSRNSPLPRSSEGEERG